MEYKPRSYQEFITNSIIKQDKIYPVADMGLGKTVATLTALNDLLFDEFKVDKILLIAPIRVAMFTWPEEINKWDHLKNIKYKLVLGNKNKRIKALEDSSADIYLVNRENVEWLVDYFLYEKKRWPFDALVIDEASSFKNTNTNRFRSIKKVANYFKRVVLLSGTPTPNSKLELWPQMYILDQGERLERSVTKFRNKYFDPGKRNGHIIYDWKLREGMDKLIEQKVSDTMFSLKSQDHIVLPERIDNYINLEMSEYSKGIYKLLEKECVLEIDDGEAITAINAAVLEAKLLQLANGAIYRENKEYVKIHDVKLDALEDIIEANEGNPILVFYQFKHDALRIKERFKDLNPRELVSEKDKSDWDNGRIKILIAHPASIGHGLNLQRGGHIIVWFGLTNSYELYEQANKRLHRPGQEECVIIHHLICKQTVDEDVVNRLKRKSDDMNEFIDAIKARIEKVRRGL